MIHRKQGKIITYEEFLSELPKNIKSCDIEDILCKDYVYLLDSMDIEGFEYEDTSFSLFKEITYENKVVGFVSYFKQDNDLLLMESYIMPEYRDENLICKEIHTYPNLLIHKPKINLVKSLIDCNLAVELSDGIVVSEIVFNISSYDLSKKAAYGDYFSQVYDLNNGSVLFLENETSFNYSQPNKNDVEQYNLNNSISDEDLTKAYNIVSNYDEKYL